jgi:hypothetical protein
MTISSTNASFYLNHRDARRMERDMRRMERDIRRNYYRRYNSLFSFDRDYIEFDDYSTNDRIIILNNVGFYRDFLITIGHIIILIISVFVIMNIANS